VKKIKASILQLTLGIAFVIAALCGSILLLAYFNRLVFTDQNRSDILLTNCNSAVEYFLAKRLDLSFNKTYYIDLFEEGTDSVEITRKPWGLFELACVSASRGQKRVTKNALTTALTTQKGEASLYIPDRNAPLYLVGDTRIEGTVYVSEKKFTTGYIDGLGYKGSKLFEGEALKSDPEMPTLDTTLLYQLKQFLLPVGGSHYSLQPIELLRGGKYSFSPCSYFFSEQSIELNDSIQGGLVVQSAMKIRVTAGSFLEDVILIAPLIDIDREFVGVIQCFATKQITVGSDSKLYYPSSLALMGGESDSTILIRRNALVQGLILIPGGKNIQDKGRLRLEPGARFQGTAYVNGATDNQGTTMGNLITFTMQVSKDDVVHSNHVMNGLISGTMESVPRAGSFSWLANEKAVVAKWVH